MQKKWWQDKVAYQIYPKSFCDSNGDGIGDLPGIISKLDYLKDLGVDIIWISPIYQSPLADQGYDISNYYEIDPRFGSMEDFHMLISEAGKRDMYILMDLVVNHCSDEHEWFQKACEDPDGEYGNYFYIRDYDKEHLPNNWRSYFGGSVWEPLPGHADKVYFHAFHKKQPDLNWENPALREEIYQMMNWWLDQGLGGFRIDAIINIRKDPDFRDCPADRPDGSSLIVNMLENAPDVGEYLSEMRDRCFLPHDAFTVGEVFNSDPDQLLAYIGENGYFSSMFDFRTHMLDWFDTEITPEGYLDAIRQSQKALQQRGFYSNIIENHDEPRGVSHYIPAEDLTDTSKKMLGLLQFFTPGIPFIYQGQEIGMENFPFHSVEEIDDVQALNDYRMALEDGLSPEDALAKAAVHCRDNARTPMQWDDGPEAGFTSGKPWLAVNPNKNRINVSSQVKDPDSVWSFYQQLAQLRKSLEYGDAIVYGSYEELALSNPRQLAFLRKGQDCTLLVVINFQKDEMKMRYVDLKDKIENKKMTTSPSLVISNTGEFELTESTLTLGGYGAVVLQIQ